MADNINLATAYVQIIPTTKGIRDNLDRELGGASDTAGKNAGRKGGLSLAKTMLKTVAASGIAAGIYKFFKTALEEGGKLQQSTGGIETLFKVDADEVKKNAEMAWKTAGISANEYMEQTTSFSAALIRSLGGDTKKAAQISDTAIKDMADNANKFGTDMESVQNAYQGFAKQNYTMLDNLRLGYGGTKQEMQRLLADAQKISGQKYDISNLADVYSAIHVIQEDLNVTGTTAQEAASTFSGSFASMKSAALNFMGTLSTGSSEEVQQSLEDLLSSIGTFLGNNLLPMLGEIFKNLGQLIVEKVPELADSASEALSGLLDTIMENFGQLSDDPTAKAGREMAKKIALGILKGAGKVALALAKLILYAAAAGLAKLGSLVVLGLKMIGKLILGIVKSRGKLIKSFIGLITGGIKAIGGKVKEFLQIGKDIVTGIWQGFTNKIEWFKEQIREWVGNVKNFLKKIFKIGSPSKVMAKEIGRWLPAGIAQGITDNTGTVLKAMAGLSDVTQDAWNAELTPGALALGTVGVGGGQFTGTGGNVYNISMTVDGAQDPSAWASTFASDLKRITRMGG